MREEKEGRKIRDEVRERTLSYVTAALGLVASLAWNEAIKSFIEQVFPLSANNLAAKFIYAALTTFLVVILTVYLSRILKKEL